MTFECEDPGLPSRALRAKAGARAASVCAPSRRFASTAGVYWIPAFEVLEQRGLKVWLVDARQMKYVPGRKSDVQDCQWLQKLMSLGFLRAAFRPGDDVCVVRAVARQRDVRLTEQASWVQRMQKALVQMNSQLTEVLTDVMGMTGQAIIRAIVAGEHDPKTLARHRNGRVKASEPEIAKALTGNWRDEHLFVLRQALAIYDDIGRHLGECDAKLQGLLSKLGSDKVDLGKTAARGQQAPCGVRCAPDSGQLGWRGPHAHQRPGVGCGDEDTLGAWPRPEPLCQRQALLLVAGPVSRHEDQQR